MNQSEIFISIVIPAKLVTLWTRHLLSEKYGGLIPQQKIYTEEINRAANKLISLATTYEVSLAAVAGQWDKVDKELIYEISHELRVPLNSIMGFANIILDKFGDRITSIKKSNTQRYTM